MLHFKTEWEDEPQIRDPLLRASWARLEIRAGDGKRTYVLTDCVAERSHSLRQGVYGSVFPVAEWVVENWWALLSESLRSEGFQSGRLLSKKDEYRPWVQRHSLLAARGGFALPDLTFYHDGDRVAVRCVGDPPEIESAYPIRFVRNVDLRIPSSEVAKALSEFVETVIDRIGEHAPAEPGTRELIANWEAVKESSQQERRICEAAAKMGLDAYDSNELTDDLLGFLEGPVASLASPLQNDLVESTTREAIAADFGWVLEATNKFNIREPMTEPSTLPGEIVGAAAHEAGYRRAQWFIQSFGQPPVNDFQSFIRDRCNWADRVEPLSHTDGVANRINALVGEDDSGKPRLIATAMKHPKSTRFLIARALFFAPSADFRTPPRLLTRASAWPQRASRAFAAELLVPAEELGQRVSGKVTFADISELADDFQVSELVIQHQIENHHLAEIVDL
jgi:IrrE N-terminal-like domain